MVRAGRCGGRGGLRRPDLRRAGERQGGGREDARGWSRGWRTADGWLRARSGRMDGCILRSFPSAVLPSCLVRHPPSAIRPSAACALPAYCLLAVSLRPVLALADPFRSDRLLEHRCRSRASAGTSMHGG